MACSSSLTVHQSYPKVEGVSPESFLLLSSFPPVFLPLDFLINNHSLSFRSLKTKKSPYPNEGNLPLTIPKEMHEREPDKGALESASRTSYE